MEKFSYKESLLSSPVTALTVQFTMQDCLIKLSCIKRGNEKAITVQKCMVQVTHIQEHGKLNSDKLKFLDLKKTKSYIYGRHFGTSSNVGKFYI